MILFPNIPAKPLLRFALAYASVAVVVLMLTACTVCPDRECPVFPNAAPRQ